MPLPDPTFWRIHGDNIIECHRALELMNSALGSVATPLSSPPFVPRYAWTHQAFGERDVALLPGYGRWGVDLQAELAAAGAPIREMGDALLTQLVDGQEAPILAVEFCSALPAGNNAWQRNGRALAFASIGVPYLFYAEVGGAELDANRNPKAPRFPNPVVPFSFIAASRTLGSPCFPVYAESTSSSLDLRAKFSPAFGGREARQIIEALLPSGDPSGVDWEPLYQRCFAMVDLLTERRRRRSTLQGDEWRRFLEAESDDERAEGLRESGLRSTRRLGSKVRRTATFEALTSAANHILPLAACAEDIPVAVFHDDQRSTLAKFLLTIYGAPLRPLAEWVGDGEGPLVVVWVTGFKPTGEDSRPDRGLLPLARMLFGSEIDVLSVVWGPGRAPTLVEFRDNPTAAASRNGLLEAVLYLSNAIIVDSVNSPTGPYGVFGPVRLETAATGNLLVNSSGEVPAFSEHDVDSVIHYLFGTGLSERVVEGMCNPPGGDWSGLTLLAPNGESRRWTSLPRVSGVASKRPDHVVQSRGQHPAILVVESKTTPGSLEAGVGERMKTYVSTLLSTGPTTVNPGEGWVPTGTARTTHDLAQYGSLLSAGAFVWSNLPAANAALHRGNVDIAIGVEFRSEREPILLHLIAAETGIELTPLIRELAEAGPSRIEVQEH